MVGTQAGRSFCAEKIVSGAEIAMSGAEIAMADTS